MLGELTAAGRPWLAIDMVAPVLGAAASVVLKLPLSVLPVLLAFFCGSFLYLLTLRMLCRVHISRGSGYWPGQRSGYLCSR